MSDLQLNPPIPFNTSKGHGYAVLVTDYSQEHSRLWTVILDTGEVWDVPQSEVRGIKNWSMGRREPQGFDGQA